MLDFKYVSKAASSDDLMNICSIYTKDDRYSFIKARC